MSMGSDPALHAPMPISPVSKVARSATQLAILLAALSGVQPLPAEPPSPSRNVEARLVSETAAVVPGKSFVVGLALRMRAGWHTYWHNPGDSGLATKIAWELPGGITAGPILWP